MSRNMRFQTVPISGDVFKQRQLYEHAVNNNKVYLYDASSVVPRKFDPLTPKELFVEVFRADPESDAWMDMGILRSRFWNPKKYVMEQVTIISQQPLIPGLYTIDTTSKYIDYVEKKGEQESSWSLTAVVDYVKSFFW